MNESNIGSLLGAALLAGIMERAIQNESSSDESDSTPPDTSMDFDKSAEFEEIYPLILELKAKCKAHGIGIIVSTCYSRVDGVSHHSLSTSLEPGNYSPSMAIAAQILKGGI